MRPLSGPSADGGDAVHGEGSGAVEGEADGEGHHMPREQHAATVFGPDPHRVGDEGGGDEDNGERKRGSDFTDTYVGITSYRRLCRDPRLPIGLRNPRCQVCRRVQGSPPRSGSPRCIELFGYLCRATSLMERRTPARERAGADAVHRPRGGRPEFPRADGAKRSGAPPDGETPPVPLLTATEPRGSGSC